MIAAAVSRRHFLKITTIAGGGMMLGFNLLSQAENIEHNDLEAVFAPNAYITINHKGLVTLMAPNPEIGQGVKTALPMILAEELNVKWDSVYVEMAPLDKKYGSQVAGGSGAIRSRFMPIRQAGATARVMLISAAAGQWAVPEGECYAEDGFVVHKPSGKKLGYGELAAKAATLPVPTDVKLKTLKILRSLVQGYIISTIKRSLPGNRFMVWIPAARACFSRWYPAHPLSVKH